MSKVQEIVALQKAAAIPESQTSAKRWVEARLITEELQTKSFRVLSEEIRSAGGSGSIAHLQRMKYCWEKVGSKLAPGSLWPHFNTVYNSDAVRYPNGRPEPRGTGATGGRVTVTSRANTGWEPRGQRRDGQEADGDQVVVDGDWEGSRFVRAVRDAVAVLAGHRAIWPQLATADLDEIARCAQELAQVPERVRAARSRGRKAAKAR